MNSASNSTTARPSRKSQDTALRGSAVNARSRAHFGAAVGAQRRGIDGAEHSAMLIDVGREMSHPLTPNCCAPGDSCRVHVTAVIGARIAT